MLQNLRFKNILLESNGLGAYNNSTEFEDAKYIRLSDTLFTGVKHSIAYLMYRLDPQQKGFVEDLQTEMKNPALTTELNAATKTYKYMSFTLNAFVKLVICATKIDVAHGVEVLNYFNNARMADVV